MRFAAACAFLAVGVVLVFAKFRQPVAVPPPTLSLTPDHLLADGYDTAVLSIHTQAVGAIEAIDALGAPNVSVANTSGLHVEKISGGHGTWRAKIRAGVLPGLAEVRVSVPGSKPSTIHLNLSLETEDRAEDGTPDFLRLEDEHDRQSFRQWFTYLAEAQYFQEPSDRPAEIKDCAALIRYAYREALVVHDGAWAASAHLPVVPALESSAKYQYPYTPLGAALFRTKPGSFQASELADGTFLQFADAQSLWRYNTHLVSRDLSRAVPGDILFFRQRGGREPFHSMIYLGSSRLRPDGNRYVLYHTGPDGDDPGEIKRLTVEELMQFPQPEWRPAPSNPAFLGVARWNILRRNVE